MSQKTKVVQNNNKNQKRGENLSMAVRLLATNNYVTGGLL